jgi:predicted metal-dependent hydrolase
LALGPPTSELDLAAGRVFLGRRLLELAVRHGFNYRGVSIRKQRSRWGSCSRDNRISLNLQLMILPDRLRDYVLLHELLHTRIKHHGPEFWAELERLQSDARSLRKELAGIALHPD